MSEHFVVVGAGQAGGQAVATLRKNGFAGRLTLLGREPYLPYQRPPLSKKFLAGQLSAERLLIKPAGFYEDKGIQLRLDTGVQSLDLQARRLTLESGQTLTYDKLLLALGSRVRELRIPGHDLDGIHYLRNIDDVAQIRSGFARARRLVIIGGGYIGLEVAAVANQLGLEVTVVEAMNRVMARVVSSTVSEFYRDRHEAAGVTLLCATAAEAFVGTDRVVAVRTSSGADLPCDLVIAGVGVEPEIDLAITGGLPCDDGITVDEFARTSDPNVFAAGDCTNHPNALLGRRLRLESVQNAAEQGKAAALNMLGESSPYRELPWFWSEQYDLKLQIAGIAGKEQTVALRGTPAQGSFAVFSLADNRLAAVEAVNRPRAFIAGKKLIAARVRITAETLAATDRSMTEIARQCL